jgi:uncharacterized protein
VSRPQAGSRRFRAEAAWARERATGWWRQHVHGGLHVLPSGSADLFVDVTVLENEVATMRDGVPLFADVYLPAPHFHAGTGAACPTVLIRLPYGKRAAYCYMPAHGRFWAHRGYACVVQDVRGRFASGGAWEPYRHEANDGWDTLDWAAAQGWCDGNIGMVGESYYGSTQWAVAPLGHPNLRCLAPGDVDHDYYDAIHDGGALCLATAAVWAWEMDTGRTRNHFRFDPWHLPLISTGIAAGRDSERYRLLVEHPSRDAFWDAENARLRYEDIAVPMLHWGGWYDVHVSGTIEGWRRVAGSASDAGVAAKQWVMMGATDHELSPEFSGRVGRIPLQRHGYAHDRLRAFMDRFLKGDEAAFPHGEPGGFRLAAARHRRARPQPSQPRLGGGIGDGRRTRPGRFSGRAGRQLRLRPGRPGHGVARPQHLGGGCDDGRSSAGRDAVRCAHLHVGRPRRPH